MSLDQQMMATWFSLASLRTTSSFFQPPKVNKKSLCVLTVHHQSWVLVLQPRLRLTHSSKVEGGTTQPCKQTELLIHRRRLRLLFPYNATISQNRGPWDLANLLM